ncbi:MAG: hypothetical protein Q8936_04675 [Bacillota bacterium]|nr:hypothetical protein [Bacillota bacterium]
MKKKIPLFLFILLIFVSSFLLYTNNQNKYKDITNAAENYVTTGFFNEHKLYKIDKFHLIFSDNNESIMEVTGMEEKPPHKYTTYRLNMKKNKEGLWTVTKHTIQSPFK